MERKPTDAIAISQCIEIHMLGVAVQYHVLR